MTFCMIYVGLYMIYGRIIRDPKLLLLLQMYYLWNMETAVH